MEKWSRAKSAGLGGGWEIQRKGRGTGKGGRAEWGGMVDDNFNQSGRGKPYWEDAFKQRIERVKGVGHEMITEGPVQASCSLQPA